MIDNRKKLKEYIKEDKQQLGIQRKRPRLFTDEIWRYEITLRKYEYWYNKKNILSNLFKVYYKLKWHKLSVKLGIYISPNVCSKGLSIAHSPSVIINDKAIIGKNLRIHEGVTIGASAGGKAPIIGDNVFLGTGCKIIGDVKIASNCVVGAGSIVVKDVLEEGITVAGNPARKVSNNDSRKFVFWYNGGKNDT